MSAFCPDCQKKLIEGKPGGLIPLCKACAKLLRNGTMIIPREYKGVSRSDAINMMEELSRRLRRETYTMEQAQEALSVIHGIIIVFGLEET